MRKHPVGISVVLLLMLVPILYLFSNGPFIWLFDRGFIEPNAFWSYFYRPIELAAEQSDTFDNLFSAWAKLWRPDPVR